MQQVNIKLIVLIISTFLFWGCSGNIPTKTADIEKGVYIEHDKFKDITWIQTPLYVSRQGFTDTDPVSIKFRSLYKNGTNVFTQLYVLKKDIHGWGFYYSAVGEDGTELKFSKIDSEVGTVGKTVTTEEHFALTVNKDYLKKMSKKEWSIKIYGKRNKSVFKVPMQLSKGFYKKIICFENGNCQ